MKVVRQETTAEVADSNYKVTTNDIARLAEEYHKAKEFEDAARARSAVLKGMLVDALKEGGVPDHRGSLWMSAGKYDLKHERRVSTSLDADSLKEWAVDKGIWHNISETVEVLVEDKVVTLAYERPDIAPEINSFYQEKETWAFKLVDKHEDG